jgi:nucleoside-diphosphate-sugar epimerase
MMRVLITGAGGFIGRQIVAHAADRGLDVCAMVRRSTLDLPGVQVVRHDLRDTHGSTHLLAGMDAVIHCAGSLGRTHAEQELDTIVGTTHLVGAMADAGVSRLVLLSSLAVYDYRALSAGATLTESSPLDLHSGARGAYPAAKLQQEAIVTGARHLRWTILRPGLVFGHDRTWFQQLGMRLSPRLWVTLAGSAQLPLAYVENCAAAALDALTATGAEQRIVNIVDDGLPTRRQYVDALAEHTTPSPRVVDIPWAMLRSGAAAAWGLTHGILHDTIEPPGILHPARLDARCKPLRYTNDAAKAALGWQPRWTWTDALEHSRR